MARSLIWSAVGGTAVFVFVSLGVAFVRNEQPFIHYKGATDDSIAIARRYAIPAGGLGGAVAGLIARTCIKRQSAKRTT